MEQKRILWIVSAVGVFLLVVVGAALILYSPALKQQESQAVYAPQSGWVNAPSDNGVPPNADVNSLISTPGYNAQIQQKNENQPVQNLSSDAIAEAGNVPGQSVAPLAADNSVNGIQNTQAGQNIPGFTPNPSFTAEKVTVITDSAVVYENPETTTIDLNLLKSNPPSPPAPPANVVPKNSYTEEKIAKAQPPKPASTAEQTQPKEFTAKDSYYAPVAKSESKKTESVKSAPAKTTAAKTSPKTEKAVVVAKVPDSYWIQVGSYEAKSSADNARSILESNKIPNEVFTYKNAGGKLFYRVRVGPYTTKSEAEYWLTRISLIEDFSKANSYVVNATGKKQS